MASFLVYVFILPSIEPMKNFDDESGGGCLQSLCAIKQMDVMRVYSTKNYNILMIIFTGISIFAL